MRKVSLATLYSILLMISLFPLSSAARGADQLRLTQYNFHYSDGAQPWLRHVPTKINTTFESVVGRRQYLRCRGDETDRQMKPFKSIEALCLQGGGAKMIFQGSSVFLSPEKGGLFEKKHMIQTYRDGTPWNFFRNMLDRRSNTLTAYFVIPFNGYEIPTYTPAETMVYLPVWKKVFQEVSGMDYAYFDKHIFVIGASMNQFMYNGTINKSFNVTYYFQVGWARVRLTDGFSVEANDPLAVEKSLKQVLSSWRKKSAKPIHAIKSIDRIAGKNEVIKAVQNASSILGFGVDRNIFVDNGGQLLLRIGGIKDWKSNECIQGLMFLETATVTDVGDIPCADID